MMRLERLFSYDQWGNAEEVARLRQIAEPAEAVRLLAHIIGAEWLWIARIRGEEPGMAVWPALSLEQCAAELEPMREKWGGILSSTDRERSVTYRNSKGESWSSTVDEILIHVVIHGAYHRGQIAILLRQSGETPAYTDFVHAARNGWIPCAETGSAEEHRPRPASD